MEFPVAHEGASGAFRSWAGYCVRSMMEAFQHAVKACAAHVLVLNASTGGRLKDKCGCFIDLVEDRAVNHNKYEA